MAGWMKIDWHGTEQLTMLIAGAGSKVRDLSDKVVKNHAEKLESKAREKAPEDTGFLKGSLKTSYPAQMVAKVEVEAAYGGYVEYGTRFNDGGLPFMRPALKEVEPGFKQDMTNVMKGAFE